MSNMNKTCSDLEQWSRDWVKGEIHQDGGITFAVI